jgi:exonuclease VII large subunit
VLKQKSEVDQFLLALKPLTNRYLGQLSGKLDLLGIRLVGEVRQSLKSENSYLARITDHFHLDSRQLLISQLHRLEELKTHLKQTVRNQLEKEKYLFTLRQNKCRYLDPFLILKRGYSITYYNGKAVKSPSSVPENVEIETRLEGGILKSKTI